MSETRNIKTQVRADSGAGRAIKGYAVRWNTLSSDLGGWKERVLPGAFRDSIATGDVRFLHQHIDANVLARTGNGTLSLSEDSVGLGFRASLPDTSLGRDIAELVRTGTLSEMSFGFIVPADGDDWSEENDPDEKDRTGRPQRLTVRSVKKARLLELSSVTWGAYGPQGTALTMDAAARSRPPASMPAELRSRITCPISEEEWKIRAGARLQLMELENLPLL